MKLWYKWDINQTINGFIFMSKSKVESASLDSKLHVSKPNPFSEAVDQREWANSVGRVKEASAVAKEVAGKFVKANSKPAQVTYGFEGKHIAAGGASKSVVLSSKGRDPFVARVLQEGHVRGE